MKELIQYSKLFPSKEACKQHKANLKTWEELVRSKIGDYTLNELYVGSGILNILPFIVSWSGPFVIVIVDIRRNSKTSLVEFQLADNSSKFCKNESAWVTARAFYNEV